ncbi:MAG TPA: DUF3084 domain-containing protein [bacterium]|nr:DUF3084 domain-containing protein [bacterium]
MSVAALLIPLLILVSGLVALIGNAVGRAIGRRRLTLFGVRPRYTAQIVTVLTGMMITVVTLAVVLVASQDARQALFHLQEVQQQTRELETQIATQQRELRALQVRDIIYQNDQEVLRTVIDGRDSLDDIRRRVETFVDLASRAARERGAAPGTDGATIIISPPGLTADVIARDIAERAQRMAVRMIASENTVRGLPVHATVLVFPNAVVFKEGATIASAQVNGRDARAQIEAALVDLAARTAAEAKRRGVLSPPFALTTSPIDVRLDPAVVLETVDRIKTAAAVTGVRAVALIDTYTVGPLVITFR